MTLLLFKKSTCTYVWLNSKLYIWIGRRAKLNSNRSVFSSFFFLDGVIRNINKKYIYRTLTTHINIPNRKKCSYKHNDRTKWKFSRIIFLIALLHIKCGWFHILCVLCVWKFPFSLSIHSIISARYYIVLAHGLHIFQDHRVI